MVGLHKLDQSSSRVQIKPPCPFWHLVNSDNPSLAHSRSIWRIYGYRKFDFDFLTNEWETLKTGCNQPI